MGASIATQCGKMLGTRTYKMSTVDEVSVNRFVNESERVLKGVDKVVLFLNTNSLASTIRDKDNQGVWHTHRKKRLTRPNRLRSYLHSYERIFRVLQGKKVYFICNTARCMVQTCACPDSAHFSLHDQLVLFRNIEEGIEEIGDRYGNLEGRISHTAFVNFMLRNLMSEEPINLRSDAKKVYERILLQDQVHPSSEAYFGLVSLVQFLTAHEG